MRLLDALLCCRGPVMVSGYWSELYAERLQGWRCAKRWVMTRGAVLREECVWMNYPTARSPGVAMQYSELGSDFRQRERVARKVARWQAKLRGLPRRERRAVLLGLLAIAHR